MKKDIEFEMAGIGMGIDEDIDFTEFDKLVEGLEANGFNYSVGELWGGKQVIVSDEDNNEQWDAIIHEYSLGHENGLLETMGLAITSEHFDDIYDDVYGWLTADEILNSLDLP